MEFIKKHLSSILFLIAAMLWGFAFSAQKGAATLSAFTIGAVRNVFATVFLLAVIPFLDKFTKNGRKLVSRKKILDFNKNELIGGTVCGIILTVASAFQQFGIGDGTDPGKAAFITALYVLIVPILSLCFGKKSPTNVWISVGIAVIGFYLLCIKQDFSVVASDMLILLCAVIFAGHIIAIDAFSPKCDGVRLSCIQFFVAFILNAALTLIFDSSIDFTAIGSALPSLIYLGICSSGIAYTLQIVGQGMDNVNPAVASVILSLESVFGVIGGAVVYGETMSGREYVGCVVVFAAVILSQMDIKILKKQK